MTNVLIVEDEPAISDMERDFLEGAGYNPFILSLIHISEPTRH